MAFISLVDKIQFMLISSRRFPIRVHAASLPVLSILTSLRSLNMLSSFQIRNSGAEKLSDSIPHKLDQLTSLSLANNCIGASGLEALVRRLGPSSKLCYLDLKNQQQPVGEEDMDKIFNAVADALGLCFVFRLFICIFVCVCK